MNETTVLIRLGRIRYMTACAVAGILLSTAPAAARDGGIQTQQPEAYARTPEEQFGERFMKQIERGDREAAIDELMEYDQWRMRQGLPSILEQRQAPAPQKRPQSIYDGNTRFNVLPPELSR